ncbi:MAG: hypothetical protein CML06_06405 [Pseudomonadales bacterium]|nr:hypothetical protein [Pseudomonadales bacterium]
MNPLTLINYLIVICLIWLTAGSSLAAAADPTPPVHGQILFGSLRLDDATVTVDRADARWQGELPDRIPYLGAAAQAILNDGRLQYGWEGGGFFSWRNQDVDYYARGEGGSATVRVSVDNQFWSFETFLGLFAAVRPLPGLRLYLAGGPLFLLTTVHVDDVDQDPPPALSEGSNIFIDTDEYHTDFTLGGYGRVGVEMRVGGGYWLGASARHLQAKVDLGNSIGEFDVDGTQYFVSLSRRF